MRFFFVQYPMQLVAPSAVRMADATDAMICTIHLSVSFLVIAVHTSFLSVSPFCFTSLSRLPAGRARAPPTAVNCRHRLFSSDEPRGRLAQAPLLDPPQPPPGAHVSQTHSFLHSLRGIADLLRARRALIYHMWHLFRDKSQVFANKSQVLHPR